MSTLDLSINFSPLSITHFLYSLSSYPKWKENQSLGGETINKNI